MGFSYVVEGATLLCSKGSSSNSLCVPDGHGVFIGGKKRANIGDHIGGKNILSFGSCSRAVPPPSCIMATGMKWINGKDNVLLDGQASLINQSMAICSCGGVITIANDGQA